MNVLGIESSGWRGGVAVVGDGRLLGESCVDLRGAHTERLLPTLDGLLKNLGMDLRTIGGVCVSLGPGSFTGLRAGLGLGKGLAYAVGLNLAGVPTLEVRAAGLLQGEWVLSVSDARRGDVFYALYQGVEGRLSECLPTVLGAVEDAVVAVLETLPSNGEGLCVVGDETCPLDELVNALSGRGVKVISSARSEAKPGTVARLGAARLLDGLVDDPVSLEPLYVRPSDAEEKGRR
ncbi:MAG: tRNA (adenosine(37)-N6)-threonylcarbamoyltransferase complex dimerization subunit type 1 TsaB [Candidatus Eisenbacteria sp.]|nr:tRNA (adenosine(37)-N6)-threonylcarbamoyltransferase complex dimerization subunit type 1 TsaB [Candidatus Eisenbacteria bacterium]